MNELDLPHPAAIAEAPREQLPSLLREVNLLQASILSRMMTESSSPMAPGPDELLGIDDAARRLGVTKTWLYRNAKDLSFARRIGARTLRFSARGVDHYVSSRRLG